MRRNEEEEDHPLYSNADSTILEERDRDEISQSRHSKIAGTRDGARVARKRWEKVQMKTFTH